MIHQKIINKLANNFGIIELIIYLIRKKKYGDVCCWFTS